MSLNKHEVKLKLDPEAFDANGTFEGYASVFGNEDSYGDVVMPGAFTRTIKNRTKQKGRPDFPILWNHNPSEPIGVTIDMTEDEKGLKVKGQLNLEVQRARETYSLMKQGAISGLSFGFNTIKDKMSEGKRLLLELKLWEWSPVTFPANELAGITAVKSILEAKATGEVQALVFSREEWDLEEARAFAEAQGFKTDSVSEADKAFTMKQFDAQEGGEPKSVKISGVSGVSAILGKAIPPTAHVEPSGIQVKASDFHALIEGLKGLKEAVQTLK